MEGRGFRDFYKLDELYFTTAEKENFGKLKIHCK
jgi:hypothetical protein